MESLDHESMGKTPILPIQQRWNLLAIGVGISVVFQALQIIGLQRMSGLVDRMAEGDTGAAYSLLDMEKQTDALGVLSGLAYIFAVVMVCMWYYRAALNVQSAGVSFLNYTPGWYVGWFFIPLANVVMPFITTIELWKTSASINNPDQYGGEWKANKLNGFIVLWYLCFLITVGMALYIGAAAFRMASAPGDEQLIFDYFRTVISVGYINIGLSVLQGIFLIMFSHKITAFQNQYISTAH